MLRGRDRRRHLRCCLSGMYKVFVILCHFACTKKSTTNRVHAAPGGTLKCTEKNLTPELNVPEDVQLQTLWLHFLVSREISKDELVAYLLIVYSDTTWCPEVSSGMLPGVSVVAVGQSDSLTSQTEEIETAFRRLRKSGPCVAQLTWQKIQAKLACAGDVTHLKVEQNANRKRNIKLPHAQ